MYVNVYLFLFSSPFQLEEKDITDIEGPKIKFPRLWDDNRLILLELVGNEWATEV